LVAKRPLVFSEFIQKKVVDGRPGVPGILSLERYRQFGSHYRRQSQKAYHAFAVGLVMTAFNEDSALESRAYRYEFRGSPQVKAELIEYFEFFRNFHANRPKSQAEGDECSRMSIFIFE
jgi:hypothetical protein